MINEIFKEWDWTDFYEDAMEAIPQNATPPKGKEVGFHMYVDCNHVSHRQARRLRTGSWFMWTCSWSIGTQKAVYYRDFSVLCKLCCHETWSGHIETTGTSWGWWVLYIYIDGDNMLIIYNASTSEQMLTKNCNWMIYHLICESVAMREKLTGQSGQKTIQLIC